MPKPDLREAFGINHVDAVRGHIGHVEGFGVGRCPHVLRHVMRPQFDGGQNLSRSRLHFEQFAVEFATGYEIAPIRRKVEVINAGAGHFQ